KLEATPSKMPKLPPDAPPPQELSSEASKEAPENSMIKPSYKDEVPAYRGSEAARLPDKSADSKSDKPSRDSGIGKALKERLFDRGIIGDVAKKGEEKSASSGLTLDTKEFKYHGYMQRLKEKIEGIWRYPSDAAAKGVYGDLYIRFTIKKNGNIGAVELVRTSGHKSLDDAAIKALKDAEPYWPLPDAWGKDGLTITGHFVYSMYGVYVR
ncbi:MAG: TonB C-terminal domain-containing protein, partial [Nitrospirae bacterium]|nr:TonB C-terminal domain-containing protein [Nitrospirota bacterium]